MYFINASFNIFDGTVVEIIILPPYTLKGFQPTTLKAHNFGGLQVRLIPEL